MSLLMLPLILLILALPVLAYPQSEVAIPSLHVGDSLLFGRTILGVSGKIEDLVNVTVIAAEKTEGGQIFRRLEESKQSTVTQWITSDWFVVKEETHWKMNVGLAQKNQTWLYEYSPGVQLLKSTLTLGDTWELKSVYSLTITQPSSGTKTYSGEIESVRKVTSRASVQVPFGDFDSLVIEEYQFQKLVSKNWLAYETDWNLISLRIGIPVRLESYSEGKLLSYDELLEGRSSSISFENLRFANFPMTDVLQWFMTAVIAIPTTLFFIVLGFAQKKLTSRIQFIVKMSGIILIGSGLTLLILNLAGELWISQLSNEVLLQAALPLAMLFYDLLTQWAPAILTIGIVLFVLALRGFSVKSAYLILVAGLWAIALSVRTRAMLLNLQELKTYWALFLSAHITYSSIGPSMIAAAILGILLARRITPAKAVPHSVSRLDHVLVLSIVATSSISWLSPLTTLLVLSVGLISCIIWHFLTIPLAIWITKVVGRGLTEHDALVSSPEIDSAQETSAPRIFRRSFFLILLGVNVGPWLMKFVTPQSVDPFQYGATMARYSWYLLPTLGIFIGPLTWLLEEAIRIRRYDSKKRLLVPIRVSSLLQIPIGLTAVLSLAIAVYNLANELPMALTIIFLTFVTPLPSALLATFVYSKFSMPSQVNQVISRLTKLGILKPPEALAIEHVKKRCTHCGAALSATAKYCSECGKETPTSQ